MFMAVAPLKSISCDSFCLKIILIYFWNQRWYSRLSTIENELINSGLVPAGKIFAGVRNIPVEDDHIPFLRRGKII